MMRYYRDIDSGDYLAVETDTAGRCRLLGQDAYEGRAAAVEGLVGSVCTTGVGVRYLNERCRRVAKASVPPVWLKAIGHVDDAEE